MRSVSPGAPGDSFSLLRQRLDLLANVAGEHCGLPVVIDGEKLIVEPSHPASALYATLGASDGFRVCRGEDVDEGARIINRWYSNEKRCDVIVWRTGTGKIEWGLDPAIHHAGQALATMGCSYAWSVESEIKALEMLRGLIPAHLFKMYFLSGMFPTTSKRSGVSYIFRKLRPTIALRPDKGDGQDLTILCCLCLHPIGYYAGTWAGAMCPTDDVIAHYLLMQADEHMFWKRANHIRPYRPEAGL